MATSIATKAPEHTKFDDESGIPFKKIKRLGQGSFGVVDKVQRGSQFYARKTFTLSRLRKKKILEEISHEIEVASAIDHIHAVSLVETYQCDLEYAIIMQPVADGNLEEYLHDMDHDPRDHSRLEMIPGWFGCLASGMAYLHAQKIHHRDIKPQNILYLDRNILFTDFGISREFKEKTISGYTEVRGTRNYWPPELDEKRRPGRRADVFSLGVVFLEMLAIYSGAGQLQKLWSHRPYSRNLDEVHGWIEDLDRKPFDVEWYPTMVFLCRNMLQKEKENRPYADALAACWGYQPFSATPPTCCACVTASANSAHHGIRGVKDAFQKASINGHQLALELVTRRGASVDPKHKFVTTLQAACEASDIEVVRVLLEKGADVNAEGRSYGNALQVESRSGHIDEESFMSRMQGVIRRTPSPQTGGRRKTVAIVVSAEPLMENSHDEHDSYPSENFTILLHLPNTDFSKTKLFVLIYSPSLRSRPNSRTGAASLGSSYSAISTPARTREEELQSIEPYPEEIIYTPALSARSSDNVLWNNSHAQALRLVENPTMVMPFTTPTGHVYMLRHIGPDIVYMVDALSGPNGANAENIMHWVGQTIVVVGSDGTGLGGLVDSDDEGPAESKSEHAGHGERWWENSAMVGLGKGIEVVDTPRLTDDYERRVGGGEYTSSFRVRGISPILVST